MSPIAHGHKIEIFGLGWIEHRPNGLSPWITNRPWGETGIEISIVRILDLKVPSIKGASKFF